MSERVIQALQSKYDYSELECRRILYILQIMISETGKCILLFAIFTLQHKTNAFLISLITLLSIRCFSGGLHFSSFLKCTLFTLCFFECSVMLAHFLNLNLVVKLLFLLLCLVINAGIEPIQSPQRPALSVPMKRRFRNITCLLVLFYSVVIVVFQENAFTNICFWTVTLHTIQLGIGHLNRKENSK